jgi:hypothetical protein
LNHVTCLGTVELRVLPVDIQEVYLGKVVIILVILESRTRQGYKGGVKGYSLPFNVVSLEEIVLASNSINLVNMSFQLVLSGELVCNNPAFLGNGWELARMEDISDY